MEGWKNGGSVFGFLDFQTLGLSDGRVVGRSIIFRLLALSFGFSTERSFYYEIDTPLFLLTTGYFSSLSHRVKVLYIKVNLMNILY